MNQSELLEIIHHAAQTKQTSLDLSSKGLTELPVELWQLTNLTKLSLSHNQLSAVPKELGQLSNLTGLYLDNNQLSAVPKELGQLSNLTELYLDNNQLSAVPEELEQLSNLTGLYLDNNQLSAVPKELGQLSNLTALSLSHNQLSAVPKELGQLSNLTGLYLDNNQLSAVPKELGQLSNLTELYLDNNQLSAVPEELEQLSNLTGLYLDNNQLSAVPKELGQLSNLTALSLSHNQLSAVPKELGQLSNLTKLFLLDNQLSAVPKELGQLSNLTVLFLLDNQLSAVPKELGQLSNLTLLDLSRNQLSAVPKELGQLSNLTKLYLSHNQLSAVPKELGQLSNLTRLILSDNQLSAVPKELGQLSNLTELYLDDNPLTFPPPEVVEQGTAAILAYLREDLTEQWISKLLVVGQGQIGKTELLRGLQGEPFDPQLNTTHGIAIRPLTLDHPVKTNVTMTLNTWDFGGQDIYHATHQFFLTNRSLFLLVWSARAGWEPCKLIYWLKTIRANAPDSPILLVATHVEEGRDADLPLSELQQQFPKIIGQCEISNRDRTGFEHLRQTITTAAAQLPLMGERWPFTWLNAANAIRAVNQKYTTPQKLWKLMTHHQVEAFSQQVLVRWLHELGDILFFQDNDDLNDFVIFKPQWVTEHISRVLESDEVIRRNGIFTRPCMDQLWKDLDAPIRDHFLRLMERFDLSYRTLENKDISLIVERLPFEPPAYESMWNAKHQEPNCKEISMKFQLSEVLPGIPTWFIARQHRFTIDQSERRGIHWRTGVLFRDTEQKHLALTKIGRDDRTNAEYLRLTVRGAMPHSFFDLLKEGIELTLRRYPGLQITRLIPCPDPAHVGCTNEFEYADLIKKLERTPPKETIECIKCEETIFVNQLLFGLHPTTHEDVVARLAKLQSGQDKIQEGQYELRELVQSQFLRQFRQQQKLIESHCPNVFVLRTDDRSRLKKAWEQELGTQRINLQLYCQMPGCMHPTLDPDDPQKPCGLYPIDEPQKWLKAIAPYYRRMVGVLKFATPLIGPWLGVMEAKDYEAMFKSDIDLAKELSGKLPTLKTGDLDDIDTALGSDYPERGTALLD
ncbi:leucine-rich repeat domain-containing protein [Phormidesmis sp. 146-33]